MAPIDKSGRPKVADGLHPDEALESASQFARRRGDLEKSKFLRKEGRKEERRLAETRNQLVWDGLQQWLDGIERKPVKDDMFCKGVACFEALAKLLLETGKANAVVWAIVPVHGICMALGI